MKSLNILRNIYLIIFLLIPLSSHAEDNLELLLLSMNGVYIAENPLAYSNHYLPSIVVISTNSEGKNLYIADIDNYVSRMRQRAGIPNNEWSQIEKIDKSYSFVEMAEVESNDNRSHRTGEKEYIPLGAPNLKPGFTENKFSQIKASVDRGSTDIESVSFTSGTNVQLFKKIPLSFADSSEYISLTPIEDQRVEIYYRGDFQSGITQGNYRRISGHSAKEILRIRPQLAQYLDDVQALKKELDADREARESKIVSHTICNKTLK